VLRLVLSALLLFLVARALWRLVSGVIEAAGATRPAPDGGSAKATKLVRDPVCGTYVAPGASLSLTSAGSTHYFCSQECKAAFGTKA
jgi:YHS domain-containing protein